MLMMMFMVIQNDDDDDDVHNFTTKFIRHTLSNVRYREDTTNIFNTYFILHVFVVIIKMEFSDLYIAVVIYNCCVDNTVL